MDSGLVEYYHEQIRTGYPEMVRVLGEQGADKELCLLLGELVNRSVLHPTDAQEIYDGRL